MFSHERGNVCVVMLYLNSLPTIFLGQFLGKSRCGEFWMQIACYGFNSGVRQVDEMLHSGFEEGSCFQVFNVAYVLGDEHLFSEQDTGGVVQFSTQPNYATLGFCFQHYWGWRVAS
jgi:hypothetical protein